MSKKILKLNEADFKNLIKESVTSILSELDWKTYANASKKRYKQSRENPQDKKLRDKASKLGQKANQQFNDDFVGLYKYDKLGDKLKGKHSSTFNAYIDPSANNMAYGTVRGWNKGGTEMFTTRKGEYYSNKANGGGYISPRQHFRDQEVADAYSKANDELWDYQNGNYEYVNGEGWKFKESIDKNLKSVLK